MSREGRERISQWSELHNRTEDEQLSLVLEQAERAESGAVTQQDAADPSLRSGCHTSWLSEEPFGLHNRMQEGKSFRSIEVAELSPEDILQINQPGLLPLLPLTKGGARREKVELMFEKLGSTGKSELELIGFTLASLVYRRESKVGQEWLIRRFHEMHDIEH